MALGFEDFADLMDEITHRFTVANADGTLKDLLDKLGWGSLLKSEAEPFFTFENGKILVIGEQTVSIEHLRMIVKKLGLNVDRFEFVLDYYKAQTYEYKKLEYNANYRAVLVGAVPHSTTGTGQSSNLLTEMESHPDKYPRIIALRTKSGELRITENGFKRAVQQLLTEGYMAA